MNRIQYVSPESDPDNPRFPSARKRVFVVRRRRKSRPFPSPEHDIHEWPPDIPRSTRANDAWINSFSETLPIADSHQHRVSAILNFLMERAAVRPQLNFFEDELFVEWRYGRRALELSIPDIDDEIYVRITGSNGEELRVAFVQRISEMERDTAVNISELINSVASKRS